MRILHLTDPHLFADRAAALRGTVTFESLGRVLNHYQQSGWKADIVALTGDLTQDETAQAYANIAALLEPLELPIFVVPGNHDVRGTMKAALGASPFHYCATMRRGNWLLVGVDSCVHGAAHGEIAPAELERLAHVTSNSDAEHILVTLHHPPLDVGSRWLDTVGLHNRTDFLDVIRESARVRLVLFGHVHQTVEAEIDGTTILGTPSTCRQFKPSSDEFAVDDQPPAYRRIELCSDGGIEHELVWT